MWHEVWDLKTNAALSRRLAQGCRDSKSEQALRLLAAEYESRAAALERALRASGPVATPAVPPDPALTMDPRRTA